MKRYFCFLFSLLLLTGCASAPLRDASTAFYNNRSEEADAILSEAGKVPERDRLLFFMTKGLILHDMGRYRESTKEFLNASRLMDEQDIVNIGQQSASLVINDWLTDYKGEYSERLWVHTYLMMNFLLSYQHESALVEARQALKLFKEYNEALSGDYFTRALIALCYENLGKFNDAYIEYKKIFQALDSPRSMAPMLYNMARGMGFNDEAAEYEKLMGNTGRVQALNYGTPELVIFVAAGRGPVKVQGNVVVPPSIRFSFPQYSPRNRGNTDIRVTSSAGSLPFSVFTSDINLLASESLQDRAGRIVAKELTRVAAKEAISQAVAHKNDNGLAEFLVRTALFLLENPDTRCWETLPASLNLLRVPLPPGITNVNVRINSDGAEQFEEIHLPKSGLKPGQRMYHSIRVKN